MTLAAFALISALGQIPPLAEGAAAPAPVPEAAVQSDSRPPAWAIAVRALAPATEIDRPQAAFGVGLAHSGTYRATLQYLPTAERRLGFIQASFGRRVLRHETWELAMDIEHAQARPVRRAFRGSGWELDFHDRHQYSLGTASIAWRDGLFFSLIDALEVGAGRMHVWRLVSARAGATALSESPDPILESSAPVGMLGLKLSTPLFWGLDARAHVRVIAAGNSPGGEVPFAHGTVEWDVMRQLFHSKKLGRAAFGLTGTHATNPRAVTYFENGVGVVFRAAF